MPFTMWVGEHDGVLVVRLAGRLESPWVDDVYRILVRRSPAALSLDLSALTDIDVPALAALVAIRREIVAGGGRFVLRGACRTVRATFSAAGLDALEDDEPAGGISRVTPLPSKGGRATRRSPTGAPKVA